MGCKNCCGYIFYFWGEKNWDRIFIILFLGSKKFGGPIYLFYFWGPKKLEVQFFFIWESPIFWGPNIFGVQFYLGRSNFIFCGPKKIGVLFYILCGPKNWGSIFLGGPKNWGQILFLRSKKIWGPIFFCFFERGVQKNGAPVLFLSPPPPPKILGVQKNGGHFLWGAK